MKTVLITGGTHGIGKAIFNSFSNDGYIVYTCARGNYKTDINYIKFDLLTDDVNELFNIVPNVDILICNSGGGGRWGNDDWIHTDYNVWQQVYDKNVGYMIKLINHYLPYMCNNKWGRVIAISSILGKESAVDGRPWFQMAKSAQISLIKSFSKNKQYVRSGVTFNTVSPGAIMIKDTGWYDLYINNPDVFNEFAESVPMGRLGNVEDVANAVEFLCNTKSNFINGINLVVDGGQSFSF